METFSALLAICAENSPVPGEFPAHRPVTRSFNVFFDLRLNKRLSKQWWGWWFETLSHPLWRHRNDMFSGDSQDHVCVQIRVHGYLAKMKHFLRRGGYSPQLVSFQNINVHHHAFFFQQNIPVVLYVIVCKWRKNTKYHHILTQFPTTSHNYCQENLYDKVILVVFCRYLFIIWYTKYIHILGMHVLLHMHLIYSKVPTANSPRTLLYDG